MSNKSKPQLRKMRWLIVIFALFIASVFLLKFTGDSLYEIPENLRVAELPENSILICLAGGRGRIAEALKLFERGFGSSLLIVGAGPNIDRSRILQYVGMTDSYTPSRLDLIQVENISRNTIENAYAIERFLKAKPTVRNVILITSSYHMRRSQVVLRSALKNSVTLYPHTLKSEEFNKSNWLFSVKGIRVTMEESFKFYLARLFIPLMDVF